MNTRCRQGSSRPWCDKPFLYILCHLLCAALQVWKDQVLRPQISCSSSFTSAWAGEVTSGASFGLPQAPEMLLCYCCCDEYCMEEITEPALGNAISSLLEQSSECVVRNT